MYFRLMGRLNARRDNLLDENEKGFTLIELLVVVIIIGILAAIAIPVYLGVQNNAKNASVQSDLTNLKTAVVSIQTNNGSLPTSGTGGTTFTSLPATGGTPDWNSAGMTFSQNTASLVYQYVDSSHFCVAAKGSTGAIYYATEASGVVSSANKPSECTTIS